MLRAADHMRPQSFWPGQRAKGVGLRFLMILRMPLGPQHWRKSDKEKVPLGQNALYLATSHSEYSMKARAGASSKSDYISYGTYQIVEERLLWWVLGHID